jgi:hypothetical protein
LKLASCKYSTRARKEIYDFFVNAYDLRNKIIQGSSINYSDIDKTAIKLKEFLRNSIAKLL